MKLTSANNGDLLNLSDSQLWTELKTGNPEALNIIFFRVYNNLYFYGSKLVNDQNLVIDTIQDLFSILWEDRKKLSDVQHIKVYLFKNFRNRLLKTPQKNVILFSLKDSGQFPVDLIELTKTLTLLKNENNY